MEPPGHARTRSEMAEALLFHSAHGLTSGMRNFAERLRLAGHVVHLPDLYEGRVFDDLEEGMAYAQHVGLGRSSNADGPPPKSCPATLSTPGSHSASCRRRC